LHLSIVVRSEQLRHHLLMQHLFVDVLTKQWWAVLVGVSVSKGFGPVGERDLPRCSESTCENAHRSSSPTAAQCCCADSTQGVWHDAWWRAYPDGCVSLSVDVLSLWK
jgi:hypothetical protein